MKKLWLGICIFAALVAVCIGALGMLDARNSQTAALLAQAQAAQARDDRGEALRCSRDALVCWEKNAGFIDTIMTHEETDEIHRTFSDLLVYAESDERDEFRAACARLLCMVEHLTEMERPLWRNIL